MGDTPKPWEEEWSLECFMINPPAPSGIVILRRGVAPTPTEVTPVISFRPEHPPTLERAKLATQAPAMARLLLEWVEDTRKLEASMGPYERSWPIPSMDPVLDVLRKAGVIPDDATKPGKP